MENHKRSQIFDYSKIIQEMADTDNLPIKPIL